MMTRNVLRYRNFFTLDSREIHRSRTFLIMPTRFEFRENDKFLEERTITAFVNADLRNQQSSVNVVTGSDAEVYH